MPLHAFWVVVQLLNSIVQPGSLLQEVEYGGMLH